MCLLMLALPLQGFAAATMLACGPNHHRMAAGLAGVDAGPQRNVTVQHAHHHAANTEHAATSAPADGSAGPTAHDLSSLSKFKCSACAACCMGAALPTGTLIFATFAPAALPTSLLPVAPTQFFTDGPERPPRTSFA